MRRIVSAACALIGVLCASASATTIQDFTRLKGSGESTLWGLGFVVGLNGTGDSGSALPMARQLARLLERGGNPVPALEELEGASNIAMVMVTAKVPAEGAKPGDKIDATVEAWHNAGSLEGGRLFITPLQGPMPGQGVFAFADGPISIESETPTSGRVRLGAQLAVEHSPRFIEADGSLTLYIEPEYAGWTTSQLIASHINSEYEGFGPSAGSIARALDPRSVRVEIPQEELADPSAFIATILASQISPTLLELPARVIVNEREGSIVMTGDVQISPVAISHKDLVITRITPEVIPTAQQPLVRDTSWTGASTSESDRERMRLQDLLDALKELDVAVEDQIGILKKLHRVGHLHAEFIEE
ncbi:MAG: flagellar basal body P-ring protein FlgI [Planctomycetota bacterium]